MSLNLPSQDESQLCRCRALYLGTNIFKPKTKRLDESKLSLSILQSTIAERYPIDGSNFSKGIETWLSIYPSGIQMEHSSQNDSYTISALFYYPIKSLVYCGALRYISDNINNKFRTFEPLDSEIAQTEENNRNPPLFVVFLKGIDPTTKTKIIECSIFVIGKKTTAMRLVESSQTAFNMSKMSTDAFYSKYGNVPAVFCSKDEIKSDHKTNRVIVKKLDQAGYFYATKSTSIDLWQLVDDIYAPPQPQLQPPPPPPPTTTTMVHHHLHHSNNKSVQPIQTTQSQSQNYISSSNEETNLISKTIDPYEKTDNLISVEKHIDPVTGQNIYVRYLNDNNSNDQMSQSNKLMYDLPESYYTDDTNTILGDQQIMVRQEKTPSPIIVEKYIKKKKPQVIIKEIHVQEPAPPPIKLVQKLDNSQLPLYAQKLTSEQPKSIATNQQQQQQQLKVSQQQTYYKQPNTSTVVSSRKQLYNRVGQKVYAGASERHRQPTTQEQKQQPLTVVATTSQAPKLKTNSHIPDSTYQSNLYSTNYNRYAPATPQQVAHSLQAPINPYLSYYQSLAANKYASVNHHHIQNHHHHQQQQQQQQANHPSSLNNIKPKHQTESDHRLTKSHPSQSTPTTTNNTTPSKYASVNANSKLNYSTNNTTYQQSGKMSEKKNSITNPPAYKNTYDLIENVENLIEKSKNDKNSSTNNKGRKIYVIHQNETKTKTNDKKYNRKIIVIDEPNDESNEQTSSSSSSQQQQQMKTKTNDLSKEQNDMNYYGIEKRQPIKRGDKPHYSHR